MEGTHDQHRHRLGRAHARSAASTAASPTPRRTSSAPPPSRRRSSAPASRADDVSETILGQVLTAGQGQNPARQAHIAAGLPIGAAAWGINQVCGSGLRAVALGAQHIALGDADIVVAGGQESMSLSPHCAHLRAGQKMGDMKFIDTMIKDGLWDAFNGYHMGTTAENVASQWQITREQQDAFALASQNKAEAAQKAGKFDDEIAALHGQDPQGRRGGRQGRVHPPRRHHGRHDQAEARLLQGRLGDRRQRQRAERRRRGHGADERRRRPRSAASSRWRASSPTRPPGSTRRSWAPGRSPPRARRWRRPAGRRPTSTSSRRTRPSPPRPAP